MKTLEEFKNYYSNANKDEVLEEYTNCQDTLNLALKLQQENKELKDLCDKYEKEQSTTFQVWLKGIDKSKQQNELIEKIKECCNNDSLYVSTKQYGYLDVVNIEDILNLIKEYENEKQSSI